MLQLPLARLSRRRVQPTNLLPTGVIITSNNHHRRLLPTDSFGPPNRSIPAMRTEPSLLCNQSSVYEGGSSLCLEELVLSFPRANAKTEHGTRTSRNEHVLNPNRLPAGNRRSPAPQFRPQRPFCARAASA